MYLGRFLLVNIDEFDQVSIHQQGFLKHLLQKPVANLRKPYGSSIQEIRRYASFIGTSNHKDLLTDTSGRLRQLEGDLAGVDVADSGKIEAVRQAIEQGSFVVDEEAVAEGLIQESIENITHQPEK